MDSQKTHSQTFEFETCLWQLWFGIPQTGRTKKSRNEMQTESKKMWYMQVGVIFSEVIYEKVHEDYTRWPNWRRSSTSKTEDIRTRPERGLWEKKRKRPLKTNSLEKHEPPFKAVRKTKPPHTVSIPNEHGSANDLPSSTLPLSLMPTTNADAKQ